MMEEKGSMQYIAFASVDSDLNFDVNRPGTVQSMGSD